MASLPGVTRGKWKEKERCEIAKEKPSRGRIQTEAKMGDEDRTITPSHGTTVVKKQ